MMNTQHRGKIVEAAIRESGYTLSRLAPKLRVSRSTLYNRFQQADVDYHFIVQIGKVIHHDFSRELPELLEQEELRNALENEKDVHQKTMRKELMQLQRKYYQILEDYNKLLNFLANISNNNNLYTLKKEITHFTDQRQGVASDTYVH